MTNNSYLWLLRHGEAEPYTHAQLDPERELSKYGRQQVRRQAQWLNQQSTIIEQIWVSPYKRAQQTADEFCQFYCAQCDRIEVEQLTPEASPKQLLDQLQQSTVQRLMLISHQPLLNCFLAYLLYAREQGYLVEAMGTAALAHLSATQWLPQFVDLHYLRQASSASD